MVFSSLGFIFVFLPMVLGVYHFLSLFNNRFIKNLWLVISSIVFYYLGNGKNLWYLLSSVIVNYLSACCIDNIENQKIKKLFLKCIIMLNLFVLGYFKLIGTLSGNKEIVIPLGISFYTFQAISYVIDVYRGKKALKNPIDIAFILHSFLNL